MRRHIWWLVGLVCTLLVIAMSARPGHRTRLATAEASPPIQETLQMAQRPAPEGSHADGNQASLETVRALGPSISTFAMLISYR